ncbi:flagellar biosynthetic protein FliO [Oceanobacillus caeni]|uniref:flagellar biosynthetic protein FliO n=1 Tax=Oceanobacillus caeni TaxID=405946 RepID=UPI001C215624|nr:flagellar biosynthetic protein FliO [Oceanobacillus caeni]MBU8790081.1 flagellar biosynthetic protein FliO [Oceanobacillus caeni]
MGKNFLYGFLVCFIYFTTASPMDVIASPDSVMDCIAEENCDEENKNVESPENEKIFSEDSNQGSVLFDLIKMVFALILVIALIYIVLKFLNQRNKLTPKGKMVENLGGISLGQSKSIQIIRVGPKVYVIGVGDDINLLEEITDEEVKQELINNMNVTNDTMARSLLPSFKSNGANTNHKKDFKRLFSNELEKLKQNRNDLIHNQKEDKHE